MTLTEIIYGILFQPAVTFNYLGREKPLKLGLSVYMVTALFDVLITQGIESFNIKQSFAGLPSNFVWLAGGIGVLGSIVMLFLMAGFISLLSEIIFKNSNGKGLLVCLSFAYLPSILGAPLQYAALLAGIETAATVFPLLTLVWVLVLQVLALREALSLSNSQAVLLFMLPLFILLGLAAALIIVVVTVFSIPFIR